VSCPSPEHPYNITAGFQESSRRPYQASALVMLANVPLAKGWLILKSAGEATAGHEPGGIAQGKGLPQSITITCFVSLIPVTQTS
jgi:hypothetical protein